MLSDVRSLGSQMFWRKYARKEEVDGTPYERAPLRG